MKFNLNLKIILAMCLSALGGFIAGDFVAKRRLSKAYRKETEEAVERAYSEYLTRENAEKAKRRREKVKDPSQNASKIDLNGPRIDSEGMGGTNTRVKTESTEEALESKIQAVKEAGARPRVPTRDMRKTIVEYSKVYSGGDIAEEDEDLEYDDGDLDESLTDVPFENETSLIGDIQVIPKKVLDDSDGFYDKDDLFLYSGDNTLCDGNDAVIVDTDEVVGFEIEELIKLLVSRPDNMIHVQNAALKTYYTIHLIEDSYSTSVANRIETDREKAARRQKRLLG